MQKVLIHSRTISTFGNIHCPMLKFPLNVCKQEEQEGVRAEQEPESWKLPGYRGNGLHKKFKETVGQKQVLLQLRLL